MSTEIFNNSVRAPSGLKPRIRQTARHAALDALSFVPRLGTEKQFIRCLMMHYVFDDQTTQFEAHIKSLFGLGDFVSTDDAVAMLKGDLPIDGRYFHLSFDDGLDCLARNAAPVLHQHGVPAIVFVNSAVCSTTPIPEQRSAWERHTNYKQPLAVMDWQTLADSGFEVGAHTRTHQRLSDISNDESALQSEIFDCKREIEKALKIKCKYFAWPYGKQSDIDATSVDVVKRAGFMASFSAVRGTIEAEQTDPFDIPRHHMEPQWPIRHARFFAHGGMNSPVRLK